MKKIIVIQIVILAFMATAHHSTPEALRATLLDSVAYTPAEILNTGLGLEFEYELQAVAAELGYPAEWLVAVMVAESGLNPQATNRYTGAFGLIQFMPETAAWLGTSAAALRNAPATAQLPYIKAFYKGFEPKNLIDLRLFTFYPAAVGQKDTYQIGNKRTARQNQIYDLDGDSRITVAEFKSYYTTRP